MFIQKARELFFDILILFVLAAAPLFLPCERFMISLVVLTTSLRVFLVTLKQLANHHLVISCR